MKNYLRNVLAIVFVCSILAYPQVQQIKIACVGNSITQGISGQSYPEQLQKLLGNHYLVRNYGVGGTTLLKKGDYPYWNTAAFYEAIDMNAHIVIIKLGTNDSKPQNWIYKDDYYKDYIDLIGQFRKNGRRPQIFVCSPCPVFVDNFGIRESVVKNEIIPLADSVRKTTNTFHIDFYNGMLGQALNFSDGVHPTAAGYGEMAKIAYNALMNGPSGVIRYFNSNPATAEKDQIVKLYWETTKGSNATINGNSVAETDSMTVTVLPNQTNKYTLIVSGAVKDTSVVTIQYLPSGKIKTFITIPPAIEKGSNEAATLSWTTSNGSQVTLDGEIVTQNGSKFVQPTSTRTYTLVANGDINETSSITVQVLEADKINRALNHITKSLSNLRGYPSENVADGNTNTFWKSEKTNSQWIYVDLGTTIQVKRVLLNWGVTYATNYIVQAVSDKGVISNAKIVSGADGGLDDINDLNIPAKFVRIQATAKNNTDSSYILKEFEVYGTSNLTDIVREDEVIPVRFELLQNYPNPFNPSTTISYSIPVVEALSARFANQARRAAEVHVSLKVYDVLGREIKTLINEYQKAGVYNVELRTKSEEFSSGIYFYKLTAGNYTATRKMLFLK